MEDMYIGKFLDDRYEILEKIGSGGMAVVYKARCHRLNRLVAIKILKSDLAQNPDLRRRFHAESQAVAMLSHPNIVSVYDVNSTDNIDYIVMELIEGITLKEYINRKGVLNWKEVLHFTTQIVKALEHAHSRGIIHRDIKPHNIMILKDGNVKVADFGIARLLTTQNTLTQEALGSVHYISPEQAKGSQVDARADLYSVGVVMYEMLTSRLPFEGDSPVSIAIQHINSVPIQPRELNPDIPVGLEEITMHAMNPDLAARYPSASALLADLEEFRKNPSVRFDYMAVPSLADDIDETRVLPEGTAAAIASKPRKRSGNAISRNNISADEYRKNRRNASKTGTLVGILCIVLFLLAVVWFMWNYALKGWLAPEEESRIEVPNFVGSMLDEVTKNRDYLLYYNFSDIKYVESEDIPSGQIISQDPVEGRSVAVSEDGIDVTLTVSSGAAVIPMPNCINMDWREANFLLESYKLNLNIRFSTMPSDTITADYVTEQVPEEGETLIEGMTVFLTYSVGPEVKTVDVPNLMGLSESRAITKLQSMDLTYEVKKEYDDVAPEGKVFFQNYDAGESVPVKTQIIFYISKGPDPATLPEDDPGDDPGIDPGIDPGENTDPGGNGGTEDPNHGEPADPEDDPGDTDEPIEPNG